MNKFLYINFTFQTLGDSEKRSEYDNFGYTSSKAHRPSRQHHGFDPFESFFDGPHGFNFNFNFGGGGGNTESIIDKHTINLRYIHVYNTL
jgi:DnaJ-class molecular chaperone